MPKKETREAASLIEQFPLEVRSDAQELMRLCVQDSVKKRQRAIVEKIEDVVTKIMLIESPGNEERWEIMRSFIQMLYVETCLGQMKKVRRALIDLSIDLIDPVVEKIPEVEERHDAQPAVPQVTYDQFMEAIQQSLHLDRAIHTSERN